MTSPITPKDDEPQGAGASALPSGSRATHEAPAGLPPSGFDPSRFPGATTNHDLCIGIVNPYGQLWTWDAFENCEAAEKHLRDFWGSQADEMAPQFKLCMVRVDVVPESEPFDLPSAIAMETRRAETENTDSVAKP